MKELYDQIAKRTSRITTNTYTTSFSMGIRFFNKKYHAPIYGIYGFVRLADEIVDTFHEHDKQQLLDEFKADTYEAIERGISMNPILHHFQMVVNEYGIDLKLIEQFLKSMEMDLYKEKYNQQEFEEYILGSAEVVGLMCLRVFCEGDDKVYDELKESAMRLGSAFQKINFLRDLNADYRKLGRSYFPGVDLHKFDEVSKKKIEEDIEKDFAHGLDGIRELPQGVRLGVYLAYVYFHSLFKKIRKSKSTTILNHRVRIPNSKKYGLLFKSCLKHSFNLL
ncbi:MAG: phytoene/squalene synthase family protein [Bacteroidales bacterium]|nr:phytoene/squalene synthase family protein [Bacteroidales bacterium]